MRQLFVESGGSGDDLLVMLHGLGATAGVWAEMTKTAAQRWRGRWIAPDLRGHGASDAGSRYALANYAADIAETLVEYDGCSITILGHSLGGVIALALASDARVGPHRVFGLGIKVDWTEKELERLAVLALRQPRLFDSEADALAQHRRQCGLDCDIGSPLLNRGIVRIDNCWRTAMDPAAFAVELPAMNELVAAARCPFHLGCGEHDAMVTVDRLRRLDPAVACIPSAGHNAMVDDPGAVWEWMDKVP
jgi:pimeloyl-ACP methyl ester carboxylesterase